MHSAWHVETIDFALNWLQYSIR